MILILTILLASASACGPNCLACNSLFCTACAPGTQLSVDGQCTSSQLLPNCAVFFSSSICSKCKPTYSLSFTSVCQKDYYGCQDKDPFTGQCSHCLFGKYLDNGLCKGVLNCKNYRDNSCEECEKGFKLNGGKCIYNGTQCKRVQEQSGSCLQCSSGYDLVGYQCISISIRTLNCYLYIPNGQCQICKTGYIQNQAAQCVLPPNDYCSQFDPFGNCTHCNNTFLRILNGTCVDPKCLKGSVGNCQRCVSGFVSKGGNLCQLQEPNCLKFNEDKSHCLQCNDRYFVTINGTCHELPLNCIAADIIKLTCIACKSGFLLKGTTCDEMARIQNCKLINYARTACLMCQPNFYLLQGKCKRVSSLCNGYDPTSGMCLGCKGGYINYGGKCVDTNCQTQQGDICLKCKTHFAVQTHGLCYFYDPNCIQSSIKQCFRCRQGYFLMSRICKKLPLNCKKVTNSGKCTLCRQNYRLSNGLCVTPILGCSEYTFTKQNISICINCQVGFNLVNETCLIMVQSDPNCISVKDGKCVRCSNRFFFQIQKCVPVNPNCQSYDMSNGNCTGCYPGYMLFQGSCQPAPPKDPNCKIIEPSGCVQCYQSFYVNNGTCEQINTLCRTSNSSTGQCLSCYKGYSLHNGICSAAYADPNCAKYDQNGDCLTCSAKHYKRAGICTRVSPLCKTYSISTGSCLTCFPGYYLAGGACWAGNDPNLDPNCNLRSLSGSCLQCIASYYLASNGYCKASNPLCRTFNISTGDCLTCYKGYIVRDKTCVLATGDNTDPNCLKFLPSGLCELCYVSFYPSGGYCKLINPLCRTANYTDGTCLSCYPGYSLISGTCIIPNIINKQAQDPYCTSFQGDRCTKCRQGYYVLSGTCSLIDSQCQIFDHQNSRCAQCYQGYTLSAAGCQLQAQALIPFCQTLTTDNNCKKCMHGYYKTGPKACSAVSILCFGYDQNTGWCTSCRSGYFLQQGNCVYPAMGIDQNCLSYDTSAYCSGCKPGYELVNFICTLVDPNCVDFNSFTGQCVECGNGLNPSGKDCV